MIGREEGLGSIGRKKSQDFETTKTQQVEGFFTVAIPSPRVGGTTTGVGTLISGRVELPSTIVGELELGEAVRFEKVGHFLGGYPP